MMLFLSVGNDKAFRIGQGLGVMALSGVILWFGLLRKIESRSEKSQRWRLVLAGLFFVIYASSQVWSSYRYTERAFVAGCSTGVATTLCSCVFDHIGGDLFTDSLQYNSQMFLSGEMTVPEMPSGMPEALAQCELVEP